jgi:hypothetical protein
VAIDMDPFTVTPNAPGLGSLSGSNFLGPVDSVIANVPLNSTVVIDIIVDEMAAADGPLYSFEGNLYFNGQGPSTSSGPGIIQIARTQDGTGASRTLKYIVGTDPAAVCSSGNGLPGNYCFGAFDPDLDGGSGEGILMRVGIHCNSTVGWSDIVLADDNNEGVPEVYGVGLGTSAIPVQHIGSGRIYCGEPATTTSNPTPAPVGGIVALPVSGSGSGSTALPVALGGGAALAVMVGGWCSRRLWWRS